MQTYSSKFGCYQDTPLGYCSMLKFKLTHLKFQETRKDTEQRKAWKFRLTRALYDKGYGRQEILDLYRFIDWVIMLPEAEEREFWQDLQAFEEEHKVTYVTNAERFGFERGIEQGEQLLVTRQLTRKLGAIPEELMAQIRHLPSSELESLGDALLDFTQLADLERWLRSR
jgi:Domain of unknown function (DUF4351)